MRMYVCVYTYIYIYIHTHICVEEHVCCLLRRQLDIVINVDRFISSEIKRNVCLFLNYKRR